jgi:hypothetical protein
MLQRIGGIAHVPPGQTGRSSVTAGGAASEVAFAVWGTDCPFQHACFFDRVTVASTRLI